MATSIRETSRRLWLRFAQFLITRTPITVRVRTMRAAIIGGLVVGVMVYAPAQNARLRSAESSQDCPQPGAKVDLVFIIDRSGSLDAKARGQTYNVEIEGVRRAVLDPSLIPRDGSIAVAVFTFAGSPLLRVPFTEIKSAADAAAVAAAVEALKCVADETCPQKGPNPETNAGIALHDANDQLNDHPRAGARRVFLMSTDGGFSDPDLAEMASNRIRESPRGTASEVDVILLGLLAKTGDTADKCPPTDPGEIEIAKANVKRIVFPEPDSDLPGARLDISGGACNCPNAVFGSDCERQVREFTELTRRVLRGQGAPRFATVTTEADPAPNAPVIGDALSLRQAIERANSNGGATTITFASGLKDKTIRPRVPLPALTAPDIRICGCDEMNCDYLIDTEKKCDPFLTIDGSQTDITKGEQHSDGILIRSDRDVVRGLRIINFAGAGVGIEPICNLGFNRIERNRFESNKKAGVRVLDSPAGPEGAVRHNIGNTISMNDILGSETPIDLAGDGPTPNDPGDLDEGPNTLLNFPDRIDVTATATGVSFSGQVNGPTAAGATVELFAITSFRPVPGGRVIDGVIFLTQTTADGDGSFTVMGPAGSPTCGYTATVTDVKGNTSELKFPCAGSAVAKATDLDFGAAAVPNQTPQSGVFSIENTGCSPLVVSFASLIRNGFSNKLGDDLAHFDITGMFVGPNGPAVSIQPGQIQRFTATFDPAIPKVVTRDNKVRAAQVLAATTISTLALAHNGCAKSADHVTLTGHVDGSVILINPKSPRAGPLVTLTRSRDELSVSFSVFDSDLDVNRVNYEFFKIRDNQCTNEGVPATIVDQDLAKAVSSRVPKLITGQSFTVIQAFSGAKKNPEAGCVRVTVSDPKTSASATSSPLAESVASVSLSSNEVGRRRDAIIVRPPLKLPSRPKELRAAGAPKAGAEKEEKQ
jgi:Protein of unknown function (DUF1194)